ncbi:group II intron reverse transcriptase/maturase [Paraburkholderia fungorum]|uniref:RNA-directed DNA polymerase n=1 Tax=Paraburkholderia fungorum TaxID=134537 RepID=A0A3R7E7L5_9BURK|nr:group II intron reverse transcriptase/maturase [Paraburkholderia fungorum]RKF47148.1 group II intron reverse transcriptase/maturase [Paraburkholderia fungorum]RKF48426.1 group II intron reverse transcriptase/maturase [Paraburkholderia fungorum]RKF48788.1 group II intron reverse transcriptase/maturase [Paraburkholderia fungorum]RKF49559.1 group II intron reverse transcriptase/maturase [Paraburkholderia fungorum]
MSMRQVMRQMPVQTGRVGVGRGEAARVPVSDEAYCPRHELGNTGSALLEAALTRKNLKQAFKRVRANGGAAGVDGLDIDQTSRHLVTAWPVIREQLLKGRYRPSPVRRVTIPKPDGGERELGIPTVTDRLIQQALLQVLQPVLDPTFSEHSYGFRPGRRAHDAVLAAQSYVQSGRRIVVDVDLEKFFDRVNHDILIDRLQKRIGDAGVIRLIRAYLNSGIMDDGVVQQRDQGTPQGGPLSPLLANVLLDEVDKELERRGHCFARYADDANVYVRSRRAGERVMALLRRLYGRLRLKVNETKSAVASVFGRKFLGYSLWVARGGVVKRKVAAKPLQAFKHRIRELTRRSGGRSMKEVVERLRSYVQGWKAYFRLAQTPRVWLELDKWVRHRLRAIQLKHWRRGTTIYRALRVLGAPFTVAQQVAANSRRWWRNSDRLLKSVLSIAYFDRLGVPRLS